jgi:hypothetical protein
MSKFVNRRWRGAKYQVSSKIRRNIPRKYMNRKLLSRDEFLLTMMRLRLGLAQKLLAGLFGISCSLTSQIFNAWVTAMDKVLVNSLMFWPTKEQILTTTPARFKSVKGLRTIIDYSEIFIETPKDPKLQASTWSDYKHHNTAKFLVACAPNSMITFVSDVYGGRASDKAITNVSGILDLCDNYDVIMTDKGFSIHDECTARLMTLYVPPGKRGNAQMASADVEKTKKIANIRIIVEQVIQRIKIF